MKNILLLSNITFKGGIRDNTLLGIWILASVLLVSVPWLAAFSLRQVATVACDLSLSITSFIGLMLTVFVGNNLIAKDIDRRSIYTIVSLPIKRRDYFLGRFLGLIFLIFISLLILSVFGYAAVYITQTLYPQTINQTINWSNYFIAAGFIFLKLVIVASAIFLSSTVATSSFLPLVLSLIFYFICESVEEVRQYIESANESSMLSLPVIYLTKLAFYIFPNFEALNFKSQALYGLSVNTFDLFFLLGYSLFYTGIIMSIAVFSFQKREFV